MKLPMTQIVDLVGANKSSIENWLMPERLQLSTAYVKPERGHARLFSLTNTLELALISAFTKVGAPASSAAAMAAAVLRSRKGRAPIRRWWVFTGGDLTQGRQVETLDSETIASAIKGAWPPVFAAVDVGEIVYRVQKQFTDDGEE